MKKNNNGFTLVELLAVLVLIGLLLGIGIPGISKISSNMKKRSLNTKIDLIEQAGILWGEDNKTMLQSDNNCQTDDGEVSCKKVSIKKLIEDDYLDSQNYNDIIYSNPVNDKDLTDCSNCDVYIYKKNNRVKAYFGTKSCSSCVE